MGSNLEDRSAEQTHCAGISGMAATTWLDFPYNSLEDNVYFCHDKLGLAIAYEGDSKLASIAFG